MKVLDVALKLEADSKASYQRLAAGSQDRELKHLFTLLAQAEQSHYDALLAGKKGGCAALESQTLDQARNIFQCLMELKSEGPFQADPERYRHVLKAEEQSICYYRDQARKEQDPELRRLLLALAEEDRIHLNIVENVYEFVESPRFSRAWRDHQ